MFVGCKTRISLFLPAPYFKGCKDLSNTSTRPFAALLPSSVKVPSSSSTSRFVHLQQRPRSDGFREPRCRTVARVEFEWRAFAGRRFWCTGRWRGIRGARCGRDTSCRSRSWTLQSSGSRLGEKARRMAPWKTPMVFCFYGIRYPHRIVLCNTMEYTPLVGEIWSPK